jgi:hypothetical protein
MRNNVRMAVKSIAGNTNTLETALAAAVHYKSALNIGGQKQGGAHRYGHLAALEITGEIMLLGKHLHPTDLLQECTR